MSQEVGSSKSTEQFKDVAVIKKSEGEQSQFRTFIGTSSKFSEEEKSTLQFDSVDAFESFWKTANEARQNFDAIHDKGAMQWVQRSRDFAASAYDILHDLTPMLDIVKDFGAPYGGMAIGTFSFLFAVAKNRASMENQISSTLAEIRDKLPRLKMYQYIYNDKHELDQLLLSKIVVAYDSFIGFCIAATKFYGMGGMHRLLWRLEASEVQLAMVDITYIAGDLLNKNVNIIKQLNIKQTKEIEDLKAQIRKLQEDHDNDRLKEIQTLMDLDTYSTELELQLLKKYQHDMNADSALNGLFLERMQGDRLEAFKSHSDFQTWSLSAKSCMLILAGYNHESICWATQCWLSPVALHMIASFEKFEDNNPCAFYVLGLRDVDPLPQVLSCILLQLLRLNRQALQNVAQHTELRAELQKYQRAANAGDESSTKNALLQMVALRVLNMFDPSETVWIILDRVDRCRDGSNINHRKALLKMMVHLVENAKVKVRVLAVVHGYDWRVDEEGDELGQSGMGSVIIHTGRQQTL